MVSSRAVSTIKGYVTAISRRHEFVDAQPLSLHPTVTQWLKGLEKGQGPSRVVVPPWNLELVLRALKRDPFEPVRNCVDKYLTWKTVFLVAVASARRVGELQALCHQPPYLAFSATGVTLFPNVQFLPKVTSQFHASQPLELPALHDEADPQLRLLCVRRALKLYLERSRTYRDPSVSQLFVAYGGGKRGQAVSKRRISSWLVELIQFVYEEQGLPPPQGVRAHQTRAQATSLAELAGVDPLAICRAATWSSTCTFTKHYRMDVAARARSDFGRRVLSVAGSSAADEAATTGRARARVHHKRR